MNEGIVGDMAGELRVVARPYAKERREFERLQSLAPKLQARLAGPVLGRDARHAPREGDQQHWQRQHAKHDRLLVP